MDDRILSNPLRVQILERITAKPLTRSQIAALVERPSATVEYHTRILREAGSVRQVESDGRDPGDPLFEAS